MALELFKPFIYNKLERDAHAATIKQAREMVERPRADCLGHFGRSNPRASGFIKPRSELHRLGIQRFRAGFGEGKAIKIHRSSARR
jgi:DNA-directed RNA polymerase subunit beta'